MVCENEQLQVTKQCRLMCSINYEFLDEVDLDVVPLEICGIVLGSPYLFGRKNIFYKEDNVYQLSKDGIWYLVRALPVKTNSSMDATT